MPERRAQLRYKLIPPLPGRAYIDAIGQYDAQLLDVSIEGARLLLQFDDADELARFLAVDEKGITGAFARPEGTPWKFVLLHTRMTTVSAAGIAGTPCEIAGRFVAVPSFTAADLEQMRELGLAIRL